tara:strand:- start:411 stop:1025 length:615 start_codon:yes stop_codon:yes gene_type:complete
MLINDNLKIKKISNNITVVDNFLKDYVVDFIRLRIQTSNKLTGIYKDYQAVNYGYESDSLTKDLTNEIKNKFKLDNFNRAWAFVYNKKSDGVLYHQDFDSETTVNVWVTPDNCIKDSLKNGIFICDKFPPDWKKEYSDYIPAKPHSCVNEFIKKEKESIIEIEYKFNRAIFFPGKFLHQTIGAETIDGFLNRRVSYTMLFGGKG